MSTVDTALHWIGGEWLDSPQHRDSMDPAAGEVVGRYAGGSESGAQAAIDAANQAFSSSNWKRDSAWRALLKPAA
ncbi:hypothetical protein QCE62_25090 [Caballeronia sp. LZ033]|uniref:hypothetical protein n=1 Tax=Caballeronia sp. LZ033 TaxID=3038566 RepID=UPI002864BCA3|nr:hypothetical protein [Caballeronia sp. LZ033]MDR5816878.1 hypothetical protein [Caballeronia sp. LZ033]